MYNSNVLVSYTRSFNENSNCDNSNNESKILGLNVNLIFECKGWLLLAGSRLSWYIKRVVAGCR